MRELRERKEEPAAKNLKNLHITKSKSRSEKRMTTERD
jgi:hypothetical protein